MLVECENKACILCYGSLAVEPTCHKDRLSVAEATITVLEQDLESSKVSKILIQRQNNWLFAEKAALLDKIRLAEKKLGKKLEDL